LLRYYKSSFADRDQELAGFLKKYQPSGVLNLMGGYLAAVLIYAELNGIPGAIITSVLDSHYVTVETL
jgi:hypothetical protein